MYTNNANNRHGLARALIPYHPRKSPADAHPRPRPTTVIINLTGCFRAITPTLIDIFDHDTEAGLVARLINAAQHESLTNRGVLGSFSLLLEKAQDQPKYGSTIIKLPSNLFLDKPCQDFNTVKQTVEMQSLTKNYLGRGGDYRYYVVSLHTGRFNASRAGPMLQETSREPLTTTRRTATRRGHPRKKRV